MRNREFEIRSNVYTSTCGCFIVMGGLKTLAAVVLIKIKIVFVVAAIVAVAMFTIKYLMGATGLPNLPGFYKDVPPPDIHHQPQYLPVLHDPAYGYEYSSPTTWDHQKYNEGVNHENYGTDWSKMGNGGKIYETGNRRKVSPQSFTNYKRKKIRRRR